jgi:hypothetical protein
VSPPQQALRRDVLARDGRRRTQVRLIRQEALNSVMGKAAVQILRIPTKAATYSNLIAATIPI